MKRFYILVTGASLLSLLSAHADPAQSLEAYPSSFDLLSEEENISSTSTIDEELSLLDVEMDEFEDEILALEEELKRDAESLGEAEQKEMAAVEPANLELQSTEIVEVQEKSLPELEDKVVLSTPLDEASLEDVALVQSLEEASPSLTLEDLPQTQMSAISSLTDEKAEMNEGAAPSSSASSKEEVAVLESLPQIEEAPAILNVEASKVEKKNDPIEVDMQQAFAGSPIIYTILLGMSVFAVCVWLYSLLTLSQSGAVSSTFIQDVKNKLNSNNFDEALSLCTQKKNLISKMISSGINARRHGLPVMIENMKVEGKRASVHFWQRIGLLNDIAVIAPMIGLLGTVLGMFYAFYDINRSIESISTLFDGLGVSVGTTVAGLIVAILALMLHSIAKYRLVKVLANVENEAQTLAILIDDRTAEYRR